MDFDTVIRSGPHWCRPLSILAAAMRMALPLFFRSRGRGPADVDRLGAFFGIQTPLLDLSRREIDVEALAQQPADLAQHTLSLGPIPHADMAREDVHSGGEAPEIGRAAGRARVCDEV